MSRYIVPMAVFAAAAAPVSAAEVHIAATGPVVELSISESVKAAPDIATVGAGVSTEAPTAVQAMSANATAMSAVIARIKALGIDSKDIQTAGINLNPQYDYDRESQKQVFRGYSASNRVSVILRDVDKAGGVLDALVAAGATDLSGPNFAIDDDTSAKAQARKSAMEAARKQAMEYAVWAGYSKIRLLEISEAIASNQPQPMMEMRAMSGKDAATTPIEPGMVATGVTITVKFEMTD